MDARPLVMVSSVIDGYESIRAAAREAIEAAGCRALLINEQTPARSDSSRNVCLDGIVACDLLLVILGARGGWVTPSGKTVVEEEYEEARRLKRPILCLLEDVDRDTDAKRMAAALSDYTMGRFRRLFSSEAELREQIQSALTECFSGHRMRQNDEGAVGRRLSQPALGSDTFLRTVILPVRREEVIDPRTLESAAFKQFINEVAPKPAVGLLTYDSGSSMKLAGDTLIVTQQSDNRSLDTMIALSESGEIVVDANVNLRYGRDASSVDLSPSFVVSEEAVADAVTKALGLAAEVFDQIDEYGRHQQFLFNVALLNLGDKRLESKPRPRNSFTMTSFGNARAAIPAYEEARSVSRVDLRGSKEEVDRVLVKLRRATDK